jgi:GNAT superfamily N-acetyltransferase
LKIIPFQEHHLEDAAKLVSWRYEFLCKEEPLLPKTYTELTALVPLLKGIFSNGGPGVAAIEDGRLVGFLTAWMMPGFRGERSVYSPEWANGAVLTNNRGIYEHMYTQIAAEWVEKQYLSHYISLFSNELRAAECWHWLGFGMLGIDALRDLSPLEFSNKNIKVQLAGTENIDQVISLVEGLHAFSRGSPNFFNSENQDRDFYSAWLSDPNKLIWLAFMDDLPVGFLQIGPANDDVATIIIDERTTSIYGAFTIEKYRGKGVGATLLDRAFAEADRAGYKRCAVDFETRNVLGTRFWFKHDFNPVTFSLHRAVDRRVIRDRLN